MDLDALDCYLSLNYVPGPQTLVEGIGKCAGAFAGMAQRETVDASRGGKPEARTPRKHPWNAAKEELDCLLRDAVREHLVSDVPLGVWAAAGWIPPRFCTMPRAQTSRTAEDLLGLVPGPQLRREPLFPARSRGIYGTDHHEFDLNPDVELQSAIEDFAYYSDEPSADAGALPVWFLSRMSRQHVTVALSGDGARRTVRRLPDLSGRPAGAAVPRLVPRVAAPADARRAGPVLAGLRREDQPGVQAQAHGSKGVWLHPDEAHFFWNGTFSNAAAAADPSGAPTATDLRGAGGSSLGIGGERRT